MQNNSNSLEIENDADENDSLKQASIILEYIKAAISVIGIVLNILAFLVFRRKKFKKIAFAKYFKIKLIADTFSLIHSFNDLSDYVFDRSLENVPNEILCKSVDYCLYVCWSISSWSFGLISFDRFVSIVFHNKYYIMKRK